MAKPSVSSRHIISVRRDMLIDLDRAYQDLVAAWSIAKSDARQGVPAGFFEIMAIDNCIERIESFLVHHRPEGNSD